MSLDEFGEIGYNVALYSRTLNGKTEYVFANAGTADKVDVVSDLTQTGGRSEQFVFSVVLAKALATGLKGELTFVGHSLGGRLAAANSLYTGHPAITFNPAGLSLGTYTQLGLSDDKRNGQIRSFVIGGEAVDRAQRLIFSKANGQITYIHPEYGRIGVNTAKWLRLTTDAKTSIEYHKMENVLKALDKSGIK